LEGNGRAGQELIGFLVRREIKDEKEAEIERKRTITQERKQKAAEKLRLEEMAKRVCFNSVERYELELIPVSTSDEREEVAEVR
jgi:hypothetical protein